MTEESIGGHGHHLDEGGGRKGVAGVAAAAEDRISNLPDAILTSILSLLPVQDSVRTSILSPRWRYLWTLTSVDIDDCSLKSYREMLWIAKGVSISDNGNRKVVACHRCWIIQAIDSILAHHQGHICNVHLTWLMPTPCLCSINKDFQQRFFNWTQTLARRENIRDLSLCYGFPVPLLLSQSLRKLRVVEYDATSDELLMLSPNLIEVRLEEGGDYRSEMDALPLGVLDCCSLCSLELVDYDLQEHFGMQMPVNLRVLRLEDCDMGDCFFPQVLSTCQLLETLDLKSCFGFDDVWINSSSLRNLTLSRTNMQPCHWYNTGGLVEQTFQINGGDTMYYAPYRLLIEDAPNLEVLILDELYAVDSTVEIFKAPKLQFLSYDPNSHIEMLYQANGSLMDLTTRQIHSVKELSVRINLGDACQTKLLLDLLRCFPCLEKLDIEISYEVTSPVEEFWEQESSLNCLDYHLEVVMLKGFAYEYNHVQFCEFIMRNARMLKVVFLHCKLDADISWGKTWIQAQPLESRASLDCKVIFRKGI